MEKDPVADSPSQLPLSERAQSASRSKRILLAVILAVAVVFFAAVYLYRLQFATDALIAHDGYFHIKYSYLMSHGHGLIRELPWLQYTVHRDYYRDHHFLFHVLYIPFTFGDLRLGGKLAAWFYAVLAVAAFYLVASRRGPVTAVILTLILLGAGERFLTRMLMPRVPALSMIFLLVGTHLIITRKHGWLALTMFAYVWLYDGFALLAGMIVCFFLADALVERRWNWRLLTWGFGGLAAGVVINPYFPRNISSYLFNLYRTLSGAQTVARTGIEWSPLDAWTLFTMAAPVWIALGIGLLLSLLRRKPTRETVALFIATAVATLLVMKARRHMDIWPEVALLFTAYAWADFWSDRKALWPRRSPRWQCAATVVLAALIAFTPFAFARVKGKSARERPFEHFKGAGQYLRKHAKKTIVFNAAWDDFPFLFFFNSESYYIVGLDKLYMIYYDKELFELWQNISEGTVQNPSLPIREKFHARYAVADRRRQLVFCWQANKDPHMVQVYGENDPYCVVYEVIPPEGEGGKPIPTRDKGNSSPESP